MPNFLLPTLVLSSAAYASQKEKPSEPLKISRAGLPFGKQTLDLSFYLSFVSAKKSHFA